MTRAAAPPQRLRSKWATLAASCLIQACAGLAYTFSLYSPVLKQRLGLTQEELGTVGSVLNIGGYCAVLAGWIYDATRALPATGPRLVVALGALCCFCGYAGLWLLASGRAPASYAQLLLFAAVAGNAGTWLDTAAVVTNARNFPNSRGLVIGALKAFLGLSASLYAGFYTAFLAPDAASFLAVLSVVPPLACLALALFCNYVPFVEASELRGGGGGGGGGGATVAGASSSLAAAGGGGGGGEGPERRILSIYALVAGVAVYQCAAAVIAPNASRAARAALAAGSLALLLCVWLVPARGGDWAAAFGHDHLAGDADEVEGGGGGSDSGGDEDDDGGGGGQHRWHQQQHELRGRAALEAAGDGPPSPRAALRLRESSGAAAAAPVPKRGGSKSALAIADAAAEAAAGGDSEHLPLLLAAADHHHHQQQQQQQNGVPAAAAGATAAAAAAAAPPLPSLTTRQMAATPDFWALFFQFGAGTGAPLALLNNLGQLFVALGGRRGGGGAVAAVSLFSVASAAGRLLMGVWPERALAARGVPRTAFLAGVAAATPLAALAAAYAPLAALPAAAVAMGLLFGAHWTLAPAVAADLFGLGHFASNYAALQLAPAAGAYLLATRLAGRLYDAAAAAHGDGRDCVGADCFRPAFRILAALCALSAAASAGAALRSRRAYRLVARHMRAAEAAHAQSLRA